MSITFQYTPSITTSESFDFNLTRNEIIELAYENIGVKGQNQTLTPEQYTRGSKLLNMMIKNWAADNVYIWNQSWDNLSLVNSSVVSQDGIDYECIRKHTSSLRTQPGVGSDFNSFWAALSTTTGSAWANDTSYVSKSNYTLSTNIINIVDIRVKQGATYTPINTMTKEEYFTLGNPLTEGRPTRYFFRKATPSELFLYPAPDDITKYTIEVCSYEYPEDFDIGADNPDFLPEWLKPLVFGLAVELGTQHGIFGSQLRDLVNLSNQAMDTARSADHEFGDMFVQPDIRIRGGQR